MLVSELYCRYIIYPLEEEVKWQRRAIYTCRSLKKERKKILECYEKEIFKKYQKLEEILIEQDQEILLRKHSKINIEKM